MTMTLDQRQEAFLSRLTATERQLFDSYRRSGLTFGAAEASLCNAKRRMAEQAHRPTTRPTAAPSAPKPTTRPAPTVGLTIPRPAPQQLTPFEQWARDHGKPTKGIFELTAQDVASMQAASCRCLAGKPIKL